MVDLNKLIDDSPETPIHLRQHKDIIPGTQVKPRGSKMVVPQPSTRRRSVVWRERIQVFAPRKPAMIEADVAAILLGPYEEPETWPRLPRPSELELNDLIAAAAQIMGTTVTDLMGPSKANRHARPRQTAMYLIHRVFGYSSTQAARVFGRTDHTTALHAFRQIESKLDEGNRTIKQWLKELLEYCNVAFDSRDR